MSIFSIFKGNSKQEVEVKVNILSLKQNDYCYYGNYKEPFKVIETGETNRGVYFVEIKSTRNSKSFIFTDNYYVNVASSISIA